MKISSPCGSYSLIAREIEKLTPPIPSLATAYIHLAFNSQMLHLAPSPQLWGILILKVLQLGHLGGRERLVHIQ